MNGADSSLKSFMGRDERTVEAIIAADEKTCLKLETTPEILAERMEYFTKVSYPCFTGAVVVDGIFEVETQVFRGKLPCPFGHTGLFRKTLTTLTNRLSGVSVQWTALNIHLLREHHFFEGKGCAYRLEPEALEKALY